MKQIVEKILNEYIEAKQAPFTGHPLGSFFRNDIPSFIYKTGLVDSKTHLIAGSVGKGNWAMVPWICIFDRQITTSATKGVYIVYLLSKDGNTLYLTFNQGCTEIRNTHSKAETIKIMRQKAAEIVSQIDGRGFASDENVNLGSGLTELGELYQRGTIFYKAYHKGNVPSDEVLKADLKNMMDIYREYVSSANQDKWWPSLAEYTPGISKEKWLELLRAPEILGDNIRRMLAGMYAQGGSATCAQLAELYGKTASHYVMTAVHAAENVVKATNCPILQDKEDSKYWPVFFVGHNEPKTDRFIWKIRDELYAALTEYGVEKYLPQGVVAGKFDSWEIIDENTAIKHCDKSFFEHNGSGVPKGITWFFDAEEMEPGETKQITIMYAGKSYQGRVANDSTDRRRVRVFWNTELGTLFNEFNIPNATATFKKIASDTYSVSLEGGEKKMEGTMLENVIKALEQLGGKGIYSQIYETYEQITGQPLTDNKKAGIRRTIEVNSVDSNAFTGNDIFYSVEGKGKGVWGLRNYQTPISIKDKIVAIKEYIAARGFNYEGDLIENFYLSLKSKPFVILAGTSGTGKTRLVKLFAEAIGAKMQLVPVRPDWSDSSDLFGHNDLSGRFHPGAIIDFIKQAEWDKSTPHFLCLDEMNLARVEYYLSDFLSIIETRDRNENGIIETDALVDASYFQAKEAREKYGRVYLPENLYVIGTVNMDETTFPFSKKVLDRANTIEFSFVNLMAKAIAGGKVVAQKLDNSFLKTEYLYLRDCDDEELIDNICFDLEGLNQILVKANLHVGYRVRDEISFYMMNNKKADLLPQEAAFDHEIMQKILPRVQGSSAAIKDVLSELFIKCAGDYTGFAGAAAYEQMNAYLDSKSCKYPNSAKKIAFMMRRYEEDGFTSYWL